MPTRVRLLVLFFVTSALAASAQITFSFDYLDTGTGLGFDDPTLGATRRAALQSAANTLTSYLSGYPARTVKLTVVQSDNDSGSGTLASAGSYTFLGNGTFQQGLIEQMILTGNDYGQPSLGSVKWNFGHAWDYSDSVNGGSFDFKSVAMHELTHALGFTSYISATGTGLGSGGAGTGTTWSYFDQFLTDVNGNRLVNSDGIYAGGSILTDGASSDVYFNGAHAVAANGGNLVHIYSPATYLDGSSLSHLDTDFYGTNNYIMTHAVAPGPSLRDFSAIEIGILTDLGYSVAVAVPEPATVALFLGLTALTLAGWRRRMAA